MKIMNFLFVILTTVFCFIFFPDAKSQIQIELIDDTQLTTEGLYFEGTQGVNYQFGKQITPHGDCIDVINGYVFVTWYKGGMDKRNLMVSRKKIDGGEWKTIEFPDKHIGFRGDSTIGDSHNTAAIVVCPVDGTVHLLYDMHAYSKASYPDHYFNYRVSVKNGAFVTDDEWTLDNFHPKRNYLKPGVNYERATYPGFLRFDDGRILMELRFGGAGNGDDILAIYDGTEWSGNVRFNNGNQPAYEDKYNIYGSYQYMHGKLMAGFSIRYKSSQDGNNPLYQLNNGLFYSEAQSPYGVTDWCDLLGNSISLPVQDPTILKVAEPCDIGIGNRIAMGPIWTATKNGAVHFLTKVSGKSVHFYKASESTTFNYSTNTPEANGNLFCFDDKILNVALESNRVIIRITAEGENNWKELYKQSGGDKYRHFKAALHDNKLFLYLMKTGSGDAQPVTLLTYSITGESATQVRSERDAQIKIYPNPATDRINIEGLQNECIVTVFNLHGQKVLQFRGDTQNPVCSFNVSDLKDGIYFLQAGDTVGKFVKTIGILNIKKNETSR